MNADTEDGSEYLVLRDLEATHERRVRLLLVVTSSALTLIGFCALLTFFIDGRWINGVFASPVFIVGAAGASLTRRGQIRIAALLMIFSLFVIFCAIALFGDVPTPGLPRTTQLSLIPLAYGSYIGLRRESAWVRHGFSLLCLSAVVFFSSTDFVIDVGLFLPRGPHTVVNWAFSLGAMGLLYLMLHIYMGDVARIEHYLHLANNRFVSLVSGMFPKIIAERLLADRQTFPRRHTNCSVLFADIVGFTGITERMEPEALIAILSEVFLRFDRCVEKNGLTKIKTIGDAYMVAAGVPEPDSDHAAKMIEFATQMLDIVKDFQDIELRIGIASGGLVAGVIGQSRQVYDVWGDVVNLASRIESLGAPNQIQVCETTYTLVKHIYNFIERSGISIKGKAGKHNVYLLVPTVVPSELVPS